MKIKEKYRILSFSFIAVLLFWVLDAALDKIFFSPRSFSDNHLLGLPIHELYFKGFVALSLLSFGVFLARDRAKHQLIEERYITKRKQVEEELRQSIDRLNDETARSDSILAAIGDGISIQNADFRILYQNQAQQASIGGDLRGKVCYEVYAHLDAICPGCPVSLALKDGGVHTLEKTVTRDGDVRYLEIKASPLTDAAGNVIAGIEAVRDITERRKAEEKLKLFSEAIEEAMDGIQIVSLEGAVMYSNKAVKEIYGFSPEELAGRHVNEMNADREFAGQVIIPAIQEYGRWNGEVSVFHKDGRTFPVWISASLVKDERGVPIAMIGIIRDMTERKQTEGVQERHREQLMKLVEERTRELSAANAKLHKEIDDREKMEHELLKAQKLESLGTLAGGIAHDFNNLLASIMGNVSLALLDLNRENDVYRLLEGAEKASLRAQDLTRQLLTFSKGGAPVKKTVAIGDVIREVAGFRLPGNRVNYDIVLPDNLWFVDVDEGQISQVIHNLVINADHAMPKGGTIIIRCENAVVADSLELPLRKGNYVKVGVQDHGVGIAQAHLSKIFDPYFTTKQKGSGLGLATSYSIIRQHGGNIFAESELGKGTTFTLYLPASISEKTTKGINEMKLFTGTGKILLMDDEEDVRQTTGDVLKRLGYTVEFADDGATAIELYQKMRQAGTPFVAVIMDLTIPGGMGGKEALIKLREIDPDIKAIVSSGYSNDPIMADYETYGFRGVVTKPFRIKDLAETLHAVLLH